MTWRQGVAICVVILVSGLLWDLLFTGAVTQVGRMGDDMFMVWFVYLALLLWPSAWRR